MCDMDRLMQLRAAVKALAADLDAYIANEKAKAERGALPYPDAARGTRIR